jgi:hypothetical protein
VEEANAVRRAELARQTFERAIRPGVGSGLGWRQPAKMLPLWLSDTLEQEGVDLQRGTPPGIKTVPADRPRRSLRYFLGSYLKKPGVLIFLIRFLVHHLLISVFFFHSRRQILGHLFFHDLRG